MNSTVADVKKGQAGTPGELTGSFDMTKDSGTLFSNTCKGIFGQITDEQVYTGQEAVEVADKDEIKTGKAQIICNVSGSDTDTFDIEIVNIYPDSDDNMRDMMIKVTDKELLSLTGGIVQGMSCLLYTSMAPMCGETMLRILFRQNWAPLKMLYACEMILLLI